MSPILSQESSVVSGESHLYLKRVGRHTGAAEYRYLHDDRNHYPNDLQLSHEDAIAFCKLADLRRLRLVDSRWVADRTNGKPVYLNPAMCQQLLESARTLVSQVVWGWATFEPRPKEMVKAKGDRICYFIYNGKTVCGVVKFSDSSEQYYCDELDFYTDADSMEETLKEFNGWQAAMEKIGLRFNSVA